ncbi:DUF3052 domain-containing protein [Nioella ostreopsis]|uniref:DUF3052 domain-containing protein n=1 Tax=Nioella ostreopsis TaxID=2448479 RepID=UPI000FD7EE1F|nr:DUF3052 domain-containing protein [Nioella ostreopsis]
MPRKPRSKATGYSGKPLYQKLGLKPGLSYLALNAPEHLDELLTGAERIERLCAPDKADIVHLFCPDRETLDTQGPAALDLVAEKGMLWISWPKKSSPLFRDLTEDGLREVILSTGWVDVKVCAVDQDWSGLKFLRRRA